MIGGIPRYTVLTRKASELPGAGVFVCTVMGQQGQNRRRRALIDPKLSRQDAVEPPRVTAKCEEVVIEGGGEDGSRGGRCLMSSPTKIPDQIAALCLHSGIAASEDPSQLLGRKDITIPYSS